jgi:site-specific DNA-methyltransferase (adenine-specific)
MLLKGNCLDTLKTLPDNSVDSIVTDPPYELGFMGKSWDNSGIAYSTDLWAECLRVLKPGGHLLAFSGSRTYHRMVVAIEDSGFEIRDQIMWIYGSGFPKSLDVSKAIDKKAGAEREVVGTKTTGAAMSGKPSGEQIGTGGTSFGSGQNQVDITAPATPEVQQWQGWGTALKPAHEPIVVARKPLEGTVARNVLAWGVGGINIDATRVEFGDGSQGVWGAKQNASIGYGANTEGSGFRTEQNPSGRWPANVIHDGSEEVLAGFPTTAPSKSNSRNNKEFKSVAKGRELPNTTFGHDDNGGSAARFFYCAKASKSERNAGLEGLPERPAGSLSGGNDTRNGKDQPQLKPAQNFHPTVKPLALMRYLVKLVTPPSGTVLDPFLGSGSTAVAAILEGFEWIGCEMTEDYFLIIEARVEWALNQPKPLVL